MDLCLVLVVVRGIIAFGIYSRNKYRKVLTNSGSASCLGIWARSQLHGDRIAAALGFVACRAEVAAPPAREVRDAAASGLIPARLFASVEA